MLLKDLEAARSAVEAVTEVNFVVIEHGLRNSTLHVSSKDSLNRGRVMK